MEGKDKRKGLRLLVDKFCSKNKSRKKTANAGARETVSSSIVAGVIKRVSNTIKINILNLPAKMFANR